MFKYKSPGRIKAEEEILWELKRKHCNSSLLGNPRTIEDLADQLGQYCIHWYSPKMPDVSHIEYEKYILPRIEMLINNGIDIKEDELQMVLGYLLSIYNNTRLWINHGWTPIELRDEMVNENI